MPCEITFCKGWGGWAHTPVDVQTLICQPKAPGSAADPSVEPPAGGVAMCWPDLWRREEASDEVPAGLTEAAKLWLHKRSHAAA